MSHAARFNTALPLLERAQPAIYYHGITINKGEPLHARRRFFTAPTERTNLYTPGIFPADRTLIVTSLSVSVGAAADLADARAYIEQTDVAFWVGNRIWFAGPLLFMASTETPWAPVWTCQYCRAVFVSQPECPACGSRSLQADLASMAGDPRYGFTLEASFAGAPVSILPGHVFNVELATCQAGRSHAGAEMNLYAAIKGIESVMVA